MLNDQIIDIDKDEELINLVNDIMKKAYTEGVSDIHIEPKEKHVQVRYRKHGELYIPEGYENIPKKLLPYIVARIKVLTLTMKLDVNLRPQDGKIRINWKDLGEVDYRVGTMPTIHGESVTFRLLKHNAKILTLEEVFNNDQYLLERFRKHLNRRQGMLLFSGMTGSGKTTIANAAVREIAAKPLRVMSIEDPVEIQNENVNQVQINRHQELYFVPAIIQALRLDIDVLYISELRERESAHIALEAGLTGYFVLSSTHTQSAIEAMFRFSQMGVKEYLTATSLKFIMNSKLAKQLCPHCKGEIKHSETDLKGFDLKQNKFYAKKGCEKCNMSGHLGRVAIIEMLDITPKMSDAFINGADQKEITKIAKDEGAYYTLADDALKKFKEGFIDIETVRLFNLQ